MKKSDIEKILAKAMKAVRRLPTMDGCIRLKSGNGIFSMEGYGRKMTIRSWIESEEGTVPFTCTVNAEALKDVISCFPAEEIHFARETTQLKITGPNAKIALPVIDEDTWPSPDELIESITFRVRSEDIKECAHATGGYSMGDPLKSAYHIEAGSDYCRLTAIDGSRMAIRGSCPKEPDIDIVVERDYLDFVAGLADEVIISTDGSRVLTEVPFTKVWGATLSEKYYDISRMLIDHSETFAKVNTGELINALGVATALDREKSHVSLKIENGAISVMNCNRRKGETDCAVPAAIKGNSLEIYLNGQYLIAALKSLPQVVELRLKKDNPVRIIGEEAGHAYYELLMPVRHS